jgi:uncharacterized protein (TIGR02594 family)
MAEAERNKGLREIPGAKNHPTIMSWAKQMGLASVYTNDEISWCGLFVGWCFFASLPDEDRPANVLGARQWLKFGKEVKPKHGALLVFWRGSRSGWQGHVGFYVGEDAEAYHVLGGNQSDSVNVTRVAKNRLLGARWPLSVPDTGAGSVQLDGEGGLSQNEA